MPRVLLLIDESSALSARVAEGTKSKADCLATALNAHLSQLAAASAEVALVGYRLADDGSQDVGCRWGGPLEGRQWVNTAEFEASPRATEERVRKIPGPGGYGVAREETVRFPVWYIPVLKAPGSRRIAWEFCRSILAPALCEGLPTPHTDRPEVSSSEGDLRSGDRRGQETCAERRAPVPPVVIHAVAELADEDGFRAVSDVFGEPNWPLPAPLVFHAHLGSSSRVPATLYPSSDANLSPELLRHAFHASSVLPEPLAASLRAAGVALQRGARGLIHNGRMADLIRLFGLVKAYVAWASEQAALCAGLPALCAGLPTPHTDRPEVSGGEGDLRSGARRGQETCAERETPEVSKTSEVCGAPPSRALPQAASPALPHAASLVVFVLDRSCATPDTSAKDPKSPWRRLQDRANDLIAQLARRAATTEIAIVSYGADSTGGGEVTAGFAGPAAGRDWLKPGEVADGAIRVEEWIEQVSNGIGGLLKIERERPVLFDLTPSLPASPSPAFARAAQMLIQRSEAHPNARAQPVVVHCTRGEFATGDVREAVARLREAERVTGPISLYHAILTESAHRAVTYPAKLDGIESDALKAIWELTSPLLGAATLTGKRPGVSAESRGMVINAPFDALTDSVGGGS